MEKNLFADYRHEYWFHVSNQDEIPIFGKVEKRIDEKMLYKIAHEMPDGNEADYFRSRIKEDTKCIDTLRTLVGITDKRMYLELSYIFNKYRKDGCHNTNILGESVYSLKKHSVGYFERLVRKGKEPTAGISLEILTGYLIDRGILDILRILKKMSQEEVTVLVDSLLLPKEIQQEQTKKRGHGAEQKLAQLLHELDVKFLPEDRYLNPMSSDDPNVDKVNFEISKRDESLTWSMDLIIKQDEAIRVMVQGLIHSSDPGQYGVNKSAETVEVKKGLNLYNETGKVKKELWGLVDGVGFIENQENTIFKMLAQFDTFVQLKSLYKAGLKLHGLGLVKIRAIRFDMDFYTEDEAKAMFAQYGYDDIELILSDHPQPACKEIQAGKAWLYV